MILINQYDVTVLCSGILWGHFVKVSICVELLRNLNTGILINSISSNSHYKKKRRKIMVQVKWYTLCCRKVRTLTRHQWQPNSPLTTWHLIIDISIACLLALYISNFISSSLRMPVTARNVFILIRLLACLHLWGRNRLGSNSEYYWKPSLHLDDWQYYNPTWKLLHTV